MKISDVYFWRIIKMVPIGAMLALRSTNTFIKLLVILQNVSMQEILLILTYIFKN